jgi:hypothetical protein
MSLINQVFARKVIDVRYGDVTKEDVERETKALSRLAMDTAESPLVKVLGHGWLQRCDLKTTLPIYYIDMERGDGTLAEYINRNCEHLEDTDSTSLPLAEDH